MSLVINLDQLSETGMSLEGSTSAEFLALDDAEFSSTGELHYQLFAQLLGDMLHVQGDVHSTIQALCGRCMETFALTLSLHDHHFAITVPNTGLEVDLHETIREDLLLNLPAYPRCEEHGTPPQRCPAQDQFPQGHSPQVDAQGQLRGRENADNQAEENNKAKEQWKILDELDT